MGEKETQITCKLNSLLDNLCSRKTWMQLGDMSRQEAQKEVVRLLHNVTPRLKNYALEQWRVQKLEAESKGKMCVPGNCLSIALIL